MRHFCKSPEFQKLYEHLLESAEEVEIRMYVMIVIHSNSKPSHRNHNDVFLGHA